MNPRILKKLTKKSSALLEELGLVNHLQKVVVTDNDPVETCVKVDRKHLERWRGKLNEHGYFIQLNGTIGYGSDSGYETPEWEDNDAYTILRNWAIDQFTDWENWDEDSGNWPKNLCPSKIKANPHGVFNYARIQACKTSIAHR